jgi:hypothetical protein
MVGAALRCPEVSAQGYFTPTLQAPSNTPTAAPSAPRYTSLGSPRESTGGDTVDGPDEAFGERVTLKEDQELVPML